MKPETCKPPGWLLKFDVTITGDFTSKNAKTSWKIKRKYSGMLELTDQGQRPKPPKPPKPAYTPEQLNAMAEQLKAMTPQQRIQWAQDYKKNTTFLRTWGFQTPAKMVPIDVDIDDTLKVESHDPGEGDSFEDTRTTTIWKGTATDEVPSYWLRLELDEATQLYNIHIPIYPVGTKKTIKNDVTTEINRSKYGYGDAPTHEGPTTVSAMMAPGELTIPSAASVLVNGTVTHDKDRPFAPKADTVSFDSGPLPMDKGSTFFPNLPGAAKSVRIRVTYTLSKHPIN